MSQERHDLDRPDGSDRQGRPDRRDGAEHLLRRLAERRTLARLALLFELVWPALWPPLGVVGVFLCAALLDLPRLLPTSLHLALLAGTFVAVAVLLVRGLKGIAAPDAAAADRRLEIASGLRHRPLSVLTDRPAGRLPGFDSAGHDPAADPLWRAHVERAIRQLRRLRVGLPRPGLARRDPRALRGALLVGLVAALVIAGPDAPDRIAEALSPSLPRAPAIPGTELQAWITPPAYTRLAPIFLHPDASAVTAPAGSHLTINVTGSAGAPSLALNGHASVFRALDASSFQADLDLAAGGRLVVRRGAGEMAGWDLTVVADQPPTAAWTEPPGGASDGQHTRLPWTVTDDYGVVGLQAELRLRDRPSAPPLIITVPLPGGEPKSAHGINQQDLTAHPWAGLPVIGHLIARDSPGQTGDSGPAEFVLAERVFTNPVARALIAARRGLSVHPEDRDTAVGMLDALLLTPQAFGTDFGAFANLSGIYYLLEFDQSAGAIDQAQQRMWQLALHMEEGLTDQTARELEEARQAANDALDRAQKDPSQINRDELQKRLSELENAIQHHLQALLDELRRSPDEMPFDPNATKLDGRQMERLAEEARKDAQQGKMDDARQRMAQLDQMLENLRNARTRQNSDSARNTERRQRGRQQMSVLQDMIARQGGLLDHEQQRSNDVPRLGDAGQPPIQPADPAAGQQADRLVQQALRRALGELMQRFGDLTGKVPPSLSDADNAMRGAGQALAEGQDKAAGENEQKAIEALQKGGREMGQTMAQQFGRGQGGQDGSPQDGEGDGDDGSLGLSLQDGQGDANGRGTLPGSPYRPDSHRDPFGRRYGQGSSGADESETTAVPEQREQQRTQAIEQELRRRGADRTRPQYELDYIGRLLQQF
ncbi:MAG TPA: DUF4175 family protein [Acetobacteraceae bacterium]|jgi:uncharacterized protein (TIGR02302 family)|nr:DUF4175 family protein [Acetobacteraceae bacterium]